MVAIEQLPPTLRSDDPQYLVAPTPKMIITYLGINQNTCGAQLSKLPSKSEPWLIIHSTHYAVGNAVDCIDYALPRLQQVGIRVEKMQLDF